MRKLSVLFVLAVVFAVSQTVFAKEMKVGVVDVFEVFNEYEKTKDYDKSLDEKRVKKESVLSEKKAEIEKLQSKMSVLNEEEKQKQSEQLMSAVRDYKNLEREAFIDLKKERDEKMKEIVEDINDLVKDYAKKNEFSLIINENAVLYNDASYDITAEILKLMNKTKK
ncbi:MAG: OmpH family outer membrane protein [Candidatus Omnitrophica bacterium]|nr:OmpH family outer membrane protein [Candidatus Omnitrophota bacterium]